MIGPYLKTHHQNIDERMNQRVSWWRNQSQSVMNGENRNFPLHPSSTETIVSWMTIISRAETECAIVGFQEKVTFEKPSLKEAALHHAGPHGGKETPDETWWVKAFGSKGTGESVGMYLSDVEKWHLENQYWLHVILYLLPSLCYSGIIETTSGKWQIEENHSIASP